MSSPLILRVYLDQVLIFESTYLSNSVNLSLSSVISSFLHKESNLVIQSSTLSTNGSKFRKSLTAMVEVKVARIL